MRIKMTTKEMTKSAMMLSIIILLGFFPPIPIGILPVPIVLQNAGFMLSGLLLGKKNGTITTLFFLILVAVGLPVLAGGRGGMSVFFGVTAGYIYAYPVATFLIGWLTERLNPHNQNLGRAFAITFLFGTVFIDFCGALGVTLYSNVSLSASIFANLAFLPGDTIKALLSAIIAHRLAKPLSGSGR